MQNGLNNLRDLLRGDLADISRFITNPPSGLMDFKRIAAQFGVGGTIVGLTGVSLNYIIHYGDDKNGNSDNNDNRGDQNKATASATSSTSTGTPRSWLFNTVPGTSRESFENFVSKLPDGGSGRRIIYPRLGYQNYVTKMSFEEAEEVSKDPIIDQIGPNDPIDFGAAHLIQQQHEIERRVQPGAEITYQGASPLHLKMISLKKDKPVSDVGEFDADVGTQYTYDVSAGRGMYIYVLDCGINTDHPVSVILSDLHTVVLALYLIPEPQTRVTLY